MSNPTWQRWLLSLLFGLSVCSSDRVGRSAESAVPTARVDFAKEVLPILRRSCWECHGAVKQEGGLRLDQRAAAMRGGESGVALTPGQVDGSELLRRIQLPKGDDAIMPARGEPLSAERIDLLRRWIQEGAEWPEASATTKHWAYQAPRRPQLPSVQVNAWPRNAIDRFVLAALEARQLSPSQEADRATLLRRVHLDLVGLPPTPTELERFLHDADPRAYEVVVDRLLASEQFGVKWARPWLDYARYADSHGFQRDDFRDLWPYRDWVVQALNADMPFDQFTIEQLAGDLLPNATESQHIATGFMRNAPTNVEAGSDPEETRVNQVIDRVNSLGMIWLGASLECAQCHDHKYDPITQRDYYGLFAFFNNTEIEAERANPKTPGSIRFIGPQMDVLSDTSAKRTQLQAELQAVTDELARFEAPVDDPAWETEVAKRLETTPREEVLAIDDFDSLGGATHELLPDGSVLLSGEAPDRDTYTIMAHTKQTGIRAIRLETLTDPTLPGNGPGRGDAQRPNFVLHQFSVEARPNDAAPSDGTAVRFARAKASFSQPRFDVAGAIDDDPKTAWAINPRFHEPHTATFETAEPIGFKDGTTLVFKLVQNFGSSRTIGRLRLSVIVGDANQPTLPSEVAAALRLPPTDRTEAHRRTLAKHRAQEQPEYRKLQSRQRQLEADLLKTQSTTTLVMRELREPRQSAMFLRGNFRTPGELVQPSVPAAWHASEGAMSNRLDLARWLMSSENPLTARVVVNRWWAEIFGQGLVATPEDFGIKGESPTHPDLLDWLAVEFMERGWSMKSVVREMVLSATYRQSAKVSPELLAVDDVNRWLARGPRFRLDAESIRDNALAISGLLSLRGGGAPVRPFQPDGLWVKVGGQRYDYVVSPGEEKFRRGLYVVWKRAAPYPSFVNFDANSRFACRVRRPRSNTPLQALTLLNDPVYVESAAAFAQRILTESPGTDDDARLRHAMQLAVARAPRDSELAILRSLLDQQRRAGVAESAAWNSVATTLLNLDETITK